MMGRPDLAQGVTPRRAVLRFGCPGRAGLAGLLCLGGPDGHGGAAG